MDEESRCCTGRPGCGHPAAQVRPSQGRHCRESSARRRPRAPDVRDLLKADGSSLEGARVLLLGVTYKPNIGDQRESPALPLAVELEKWGATVEFHDPFVESWNLRGRSVQRVENLEKALGEADVTALLQNHRDYDLDLVGRTARRLLDTRGVVRVEGVERL